MCRPGDLCAAADGRPPYPGRARTPGDPARRRAGGYRTSLDGMAVVKINAIEVPEGAGPELEKRFAHRLHAVDGQPGFLSFELLRPVKGDDRYFVVTHWDTEESFQAWLNGPAMEAHSGERARPVASGSSLLEFEVVQRSVAGES